MSSPIVPFRETIIPPPKVDMVNEVIEKPQTKKIVKVTTFTYSFFLICFHNLKIMLLNNIYCKRLEF